MPGPAPKDPATRARRNTVSTAATIEAEPATMPELGRSRPDRKRWHAETRAWWATIWASPISGRWIDAHVPGLRALARLVDDFWRERDPVKARQLHAEVRLATREFGLSPMAARSMNWEFRRPVPQQERAAPLPPGTDPRKILSLPTSRPARDVG